MDFIPWAKPDYWGNEKKYVNEALETTWISGGQYLDKLEKYFADEFGMKYSLTTSNGTTSIHLAYLAIDIKQGDEIIVPGFAFMAAANIALHLGAKPVFVDVDEKTWCIDINDIEKKISKKTKAIIPVHTYGNVCDMDSIMDIAKKHNIWVIEDVAEALFSKYNNKYSGTFGHLNSFSFQATKTITTGEGGIVLTNEDKFFNTMSLYRSHGLTERGRYWHEIPGHNFRLTNLQAALGVAQFERKDSIIASRERMHSLYLKYLSEIDGIEMQFFSPKVTPVLWAFAIKLSASAFPQGRDVLMQQLRECGIETRPGFTASSSLRIYDKHDVASSNMLSETVISLPSFPSLTEENIQYICNQLNKLKK